MSVENPLFTVFTPTYNRAHTLHRVFDSLKKQTFKKFEWLVIDDGSTDETRKKIEAWILEADFDIRYFYQENLGKHKAFNRAVHLAKGEFFVPLDSDDACFPHALNRFKILWDEIPNQNKPLFSGICVHCQDQTSVLVGNLFLKDKMDSDSCEMFYKYGLKGEKWGFHQTKILKAFPFPEIPGVSFVPESIVWHAIAKQYKIRFVNEILRIYYTNNQSSLTKQKIKVNYKAKQLYYKWVLINDRGWFFKNPWIFFKYFVQWIRFSIYSIFKVFL